MRRRLFNLATAVSLVLCAAVIVLWVRSYHVADAIVTTFDGGPRVEIGSGGGSLLLASFRNSLALRPQKWSLSSRRLHDGFLFGWDGWRGLGFGFSTRVGGAVPTQAVMLAIPYWFVAVLLLACPVARLGVAMRVRRNGTENSCVHCGYDLRASPDRCPECGKVPSAK